MLTTMMVGAMAFALAFAMLYGYRVREGMIKNPDIYHLSHQMGLLGCGLALACWGIVWHWVSLSAVCWHYWWLGIVPFSLVYGFQAVAEKDGGFGEVFGNWFVGSLVLCIPILGPFATVAFAGISLSSVIEHWTEVAMVAKKVSILE